MARKQPSPQAVAADVLDARAATIREIRAMAGRAFLSGPKRYKVAELEGPLLDLAVAKAEGLSATIYHVQNAIAPFYECCVLDETGRLQYQFLPSRSWMQGGPIIDEKNIHLVGRDAGDQLCSAFINPYFETVHGTHEAYASGSTMLLAAMRCDVLSEFGEEVVL